MVVRMPGINESRATRPRAGIGRIATLGAALFAAWFGPPAGAQEYGDPAFHRELAAFHAPVIVQGLGHDPRGDVFTKVDFDGDLDSDNNWGNLGAVERTGAWVYYDVIEAKNHWFITYGLFYPRDYSRICVFMHCHENDFEGMRVTVEKTSERPQGRVILLEALAHDNIRYDQRPAMAGESTVVVIEAGGHGIHSWNYRRADRRNRVYSYRGDAHAERGYDLVPISTLWEIRGNVGRGRTWDKTFDYAGERFALEDLPTAFGGRKYGRGFAKPAWAWSPRGQGLARGDWFLDPIHSQCSTVGCPAGSDGNYVYNPYVGIAD
jgi:hypothetical protein